MMSPDAGGTDQISQNRGYVAIPEVGDQVMVGFVHNHPDRPFVMGGMFQEYFFNQKDKFSQLEYSGDEAALYFGGGYMQRIGNNAYMQIGAMYNVLYDKDKSVFGSGLIPSVGVVFGL